jgi:outer membrane protein assembly factor BamB
MASNATFQGIFPTPVSVRLTATTITDIYTAVDNNDVIVAVGMANETGTAATCMIDRFDGTTNWHTWSANIAANSTLIFEYPLRLLTGHKIKATAGTANAITVTVLRATIPGRNIAGQG